MSKRILSSAAIVVFMAVSTSPAVGQGDPVGTEPVPTGVQIGQETMKIKLKGDDIPQYAVVTMFFIHMHWFIDEMHSNHRRFLSKLGMEHDSPVEEFVAGATRKAMEIISMPDFDISLTGNKEEYRKHQLEKMKEKARDLGTVFQSLLDGFEEAGLDSMKIVQYCEEEVRPSISHSASSDDSLERYMAAASEFDKQLSAY